MGLSSGSGMRQFQGGVTLAITAGTTQTAAGATVLSGYLNEVTVVAVDGDGVKLPAGCPQGTVVYIANRDAAQDIYVYPNAGGTVNGGTATTGRLTVGETQGVVCVQAGTDGLTWLAVLGAVCTAA